jgi:hypothetical protein
MGAAIVRRARGVDQHSKLGQRVERDKDRTGGQRRADHPIGHPHWDGGDVLVVIRQPELAPRAYRPPHDEGLAVQRMPRIVDRDLLSVVGRM